MNLITILGSLVSLGVSATLLVSKIHETREQMRDNKIIVGVVGKVPTELASFRDFTSYAKAKKSPDELVILHCRVLSYALRRCDFVIAQYGNDEKIIYTDDHEQILRLAQGFAGV